MTRPPFEWIALARLLGDLLLLELDAEQLERLAQPELRAALHEVGIDLPARASPATIEELGAEFFEAFVQPAEGGPLVQSLWTRGSYEAEPATGLRALAEAAGFEHDPVRTRGAPHDHLGSILHLWAESAELAPELARRLQSEHMRWALAPLRRLARGQGVYAGVARATGDLVAELCAGSDERS